MLFLAEAANKELPIEAVLAFGVMAGLVVLPFAIASRRASWGALAGGLAALVCCLCGVTIWPGVTDDMAGAVLLAGPMVLAGLYGLVHNPGADRGVAAAPVKL